MEQLELFDQRQGIDLDALTRAYPWLLGHLKPEATKVTRKWGHYKVLASGPNWKVKLLVVDPFQATSLQLHHMRSELWFFLDTGEVRTVAQGQKHQLVNASPDPVEVLEIQFGTCLEEDIVRFDE